MFSLLTSQSVKSNAAVDLPVEQRLSHDDILHNINTFLFAGSDTTSLALVWTFLLLAKHPEIQTRLRAELLSAPRPPALADDDTGELWQIISNLPLLDKVCRE